MSAGFYKRCRGLLEHIEAGTIDLLEDGIHDYLNLKANLLIGEPLLHPSRSLLYERSCNSRSLPPRFGTHDPALPRTFGGYRLAQDVEKTRKAWQLPGIGLSGKCP
jgi:hypothetical protein